MTPDRPEEPQAGGELQPDLVGLRIWLADNPVEHRPKVVVFPLELVEPDPMVLTVIGALRRPNQTEVVRRMPMSYLWQLAALFESFERVFADGRQHAETAQFSRWLFGDQQVVVAEVANPLQQLLRGCGDIRAGRGRGLERPPARKDAEPPEQLLYIWPEQFLTPSNCRPQGLLPRCPVLLLGDRPIEHPAASSPSSSPPKLRHPSPSPP